jgi:hypothetical protein
MKYYTTEEVDIESDAGYYHMVYIREFVTRKARRNYLAGSDTARKIGRRALMAARKA